VNEWPLSWPIRLGPFWAAVGQDKSSAVVAGQFSIYAHKYLSTECLSASADLLCTQTRTGQKQSIKERDARFARGVTAEHT